MEFCSRCQGIKPFRVEEYSFSYMTKVCCDCGMSMGTIGTEGLNKLLNELNFYKEKFYKTELETCQKNQE